MGKFLILVIIVVLLYPLNKWLTKVNNKLEDYNEKNKDESIKPKSKQNSKYFRVAGVTKKNEEGKEVQTILKRIANEYKREDHLDSFDGMTNREIINDYKEGLVSGSIGEFEGQYLYDAVELVEEPDNPYDENAIKVYLKDLKGKNHHVGYIRKADNQKLKAIINENKINRMTVEFTGGKYKMVDHDEFDDSFTIEVDGITRGLSIGVTLK